MKLTRLHSLTEALYRFKLINEHFASGGGSYFNKPLPSFDLGAGKSKELTPELEKTLQPVTKPGALRVTEKPQLPAKEDPTDPALQAGPRYPKGIGVTASGANLDPENDPTLAAKKKADLLKWLNSLQRTRL